LIWANLLLWGEKESRTGCCARAADQKLIKRKTIFSYRLLSESRGHPWSNVGQATDSLAMEVPIAKLDVAEYNRLGAEKFPKNYNRESPIKYIFEVLLGGVAKKAWP
jgi:hypothetical protein